MDENKDQFNKDINQYALKNQYGLSPIPYHTHNGTDSVPINIESINGFPSNPSNGDSIIYNSTTKQWDAGSAGVTTKAYILTRDLASASGNVTQAHGLGKIPTYVKSTAIFWDDTNSTQINGFGTFDGTNYKSVYWGYNTAISKPGVYSSTGTMGLFGFDGSNYQFFTLTLDITNITLVWTKVGSPTGSVITLIEAY